MTTKYLFDLETNGFLDVATVIHVLAIKDADTGETWDYSDVLYGPGSIEKGLRKLMTADTLIGHNIIPFDLPVIKKLFPWFSFTGVVRDTLVLTRLIWSDVWDNDGKLVRQGRLPRRHVGAHSLEAWGYRLGVMKGEYGKDEKGNTKEGVWETWNPEMHSYGIQDVEVTGYLWEAILRKQAAEQAVELEHAFATIINMQVANGFSFNEAAAVVLYTQLVKRREELKVQLKVAFPPRWVGEERVVKRTANFWRANDLGLTHPKRGLGSFEEQTEGSTYSKLEWEEFNPTSRHHIARRLKEKGWEPQEFTPEGSPKIDETILEKLIYPEADLLAEHFLVDKRIAQIAEGDQAWLKLVKKGRIHGSVNPNGAVTGRCTHSRPNIAQVPKVGSPFGAECRALFTARKGWLLVGADLSGLELRCLAHFMALYDAGEYGRILLDGDVHWANVVGLGIVALGTLRDDHLLSHKIFRNGAKTFIYAYLYGAGDEKIGATVLDIVIALKKAGEPWEDVHEAFFGTAKKITPALLKKAGKQLKASFLANFPALKDLKDALTVKARAGFIKGLDGRLLSIRSPHAALNTLLQSAGALIAKQATVFAYEELTTRGYVFGRDWALVAHVHDELQVEAKKELADEVGTVLVDAMRRAGEQFKFRIAIAGEYKLGENWCDTH